jgi:pyruvate dehydrogenase E1 component alpha subunit
MGGFLHLYIGQESVAVGTCSLHGTERPCHHRLPRPRPRPRGRHGHGRVHGRALRQGDRLLQGQGRLDALLRSVDKNFWGGHGIVAGQTPLGVGLAYASNTRASRAAAWPTSAMAPSTRAPSTSRSTWPRCGTSRSSSSSRTTAIRWAPARNARPPSSPAWPSAPRATAWTGTSSTARTSTRCAPRPDDAMERAREKSRPTFSRSTPTATTATRSPMPTHKGYRTAEEIEFYKQHHDPIMLWEKRLRDRGRGR